MTPTHSDPDAALTAFALADPGLPPDARAAVEARLTTDEAAKQEVEATRNLGLVLSAAFAAEVAATPKQGVTVPKKPNVTPRAYYVRRIAYGATAAGLLIAVLVGAVTTLGSNASSKFSTVGFAIAGGPNLRGAPAAMRDSWGDVATPPRSESKPVDDVLTYQTPPAPALPRPTASSVPVSPNIDSSPGLPHPFDPSGGAPGKMAPAADSAPEPPPHGPAGSKSAPRFHNVTVPAKPADGYVQEPDGRYSLIPPGLQPRLAGGDQFSALVENPFTPVEGLNALSTFGVDVDTASYAIVRNYLNNGQLPPPAAVRLEEIVNYFRYQDKPPSGDDPFAVTVEMADCPWATGHRLARIGLKAKPVATDKRPPSNLVFLVDVSGSMGAPNKLPLVKSALKMLVGQLGENDRVAMVVYAGAAGLVLDSTSASDKNRILAALDRLESGGSTNGAGGLQQAYAVASEHFIKNGTNRVVLCTDGDWNVGTTGTDALVALIEEKRKTGVFLSVFGFGMGNLRDEMMVKLAGKGNGNYGYIDTLKEAHKALVEQIGGTLVTVAKDVKIQVEFNPAAVKAYRLLGYEKRALAAKDFADDTKDAGEMGAGHVVTALYELVPVGAAEKQPADGGLRYQPKPDAPKPAADAPKVGDATEAFLVKMRHKKPDGDVSTLRELPVANKSGRYDDASEDFRFSAAAAAFALVLRNSEYKGTASLPLAQELAESALRFDPSGYRAEFVELVRKARTLSGQ